MQQVPAGAQLDIGRGLNTATGKVFRTAIEFDEPMPVATGQKREFALESVVSSRELVEKLNVSVSASASGIGWEGSAGFRLAQQRAINNYYTYALIRFEINNAARLLRNPRLTQEARDKLINEGWDAFTTLYGWEYVEGVITGGVYYALIEVQTTNELQQREVAVQLSGSYGLFEGSASVEHSLREVSSRIATSIFVKQDAGNAADPMEITLEEMLVQVRNFPQLVGADPVPVIALTVDYRSTVPLPTVEAQNSLLRIRQRDSLEDLGRQYLKLRDYKANLQFVLDHWTEFDDFRALDPHALHEKRQQYQDLLGKTADEIDKVVRQAKHCTEDISQCETYASTLDLLPLPKIGGELMTLQQMEENLNTLRNELAARIAPMEAQLSDLSAWRGGVDHNMLHYHKCFETLLPMHGKIRGGTFGIAAGLSEGRVRIDFGRTFPSQPVVVATMLSPHELIVVETYNVTTTGFDAWVVRLRPGAWAAEQVIQWIAIVPW